MYLIQCIRFGSWKVRRTRLNRALGDGHLSYAILNTSHFIPQDFWMRLIVSLSQSGSLRPSYSRRAFLTSGHGVDWLSVDSTAESSRKVLQHQRVFQCAFVFPEMNSVQDNSQALDLYLWVVFLGCMAYKMTKRHLHHIGPMRRTANERPKSLKGLHLQ